MDIIDKNEIKNLFTLFLLAKFIKTSYLIFNAKYILNFLFNKFN